MAKTNQSFKIEKSLQHLEFLNIKGASSGTKFFATGKSIDSYSPVDGKLIASVKTASEKDYEKIIKLAQQASSEFRLMPAPKRGEIIRQFGLN
jgi:aldehyde dehydrogenase (NAD+)